MSKTFNALLASVITAVALGTGANATPIPSVGGGTYKGATCNSARVNFVTLQDVQSTLGFGGTSAGATLIAAPIEEAEAAGLLLTFKYNAADSTHDNDFRNLKVNFLPGSDGVKRETRLVYCFQANHGAGKEINYSVQLNKLPVTAIPKSAGFKSVSQASSDFAGLDVANMVLRRVTVFLQILPGNEAGNITVGDETLQVASGTIDAMRVSLNQGDCNALFDCPDQAAAAAAQN
jgi:hypothetical protein